MSNPYWLAVTLAIAFEIGAAASLASLVVLDKMNKGLIWALFIAITLMQMQGNMYYAFKNLNNYQSWVELFNLVDEDPLYQKRILSFVSGAILPLVALGFIKSLVDYIKPSEEKPAVAIEENVESMRKVVKAYDDLADEMKEWEEASLTDLQHLEDLVEETKEKVFEHPDWNGVDEHWNGDDELFDDELIYHDESFDDELNFVNTNTLENDTWDWNDTIDKSNTHLNNIPDSDEWSDEYTSNMHYEFEEDSLKYQDINLIEDESEEWDEDHALDMVLNNMVDDFDGNDFDAIGEELEADNFMESNFIEDDMVVDPPNDALIAASEKYKDIVEPKEPVKDVDASYKFGKNLYNTMMSKINTDHLPKPSVEEGTKAYNNLGLINKKR
jgi:hypothetical protein